MDTKPELHRKGSALKRKGKKKEKKSKKKKNPLAGK